LGPGEAALLPPGAVTAESRVSADLPRAVSRGIVNGAEGDPPLAADRVAERQAKINDANGLSGPSGARGEAVGQRASTGGWVLRRRSDLNLPAPIGD